MTLGDDFKGDGFSKFIRSAARGSTTPNNGDTYFGFRLCVTLP